MDASKSFTYIFDDKTWISKLAIGALITLVPILNFAWTGYLIDIMRRVMKSDPEPLPDWNDFGSKFMDGLLVAVAGFIYALPIILVVCLPLGFFVLPTALSQGNGDLHHVTDALAAAGGILLLCLSCFFVIYGIFLSLLMPALQIIYARERTFGAFFNISEAWQKISRNSGAFATAWLASLLVNFIMPMVIGAVGALVSWIPCIGQIIAIILSLAAIVYGTAVFGHLFGQYGAAAYEPLQA
jgi:hypothetical protein